VPEERKYGNEYRRKSSQLTSTTLLITVGNVLSGARRRLNNANETNALPAVKTFVFDRRT
jgi:hypothetical protein